MEKSHVHAHGNINDIDATNDQQAHGQPSQYCDISLWTDQAATSRFWTHGQQLMQLPWQAMSACTCHCQQLQMAPTLQPTSRSYDLRRGRDHELQGQTDQGVGLRAGANPMQQGLNLRSHLELATSTIGMYMYTCVASTAVSAYSPMHMATLQPYTHAYATLQLPLAHAPAPASDIPGKRRRLSRSLITQASLVLEEFKDSAADKEDDKYAKPLSPPGTCRWQALQLCPAADQTDIDGTGAAAGTCAEFEGLSVVVGINSVGSGGTGVGPALLPSLLTKPCYTPPASRSSSRSVPHIACPNPPLLLITEQPAQFGRFRYESEHRQTCLEGRTAGLFPAVCVNPLYRHLVLDDLQVHASLVRRCNDELNHPMPHWHVLAGKDNGPAIQAVVDGKAVFQHLVVKRQRNCNAEQQNRDDHRVVRLKFSIQLQTPDGLLESYVISDPVFSACLRIDRISHTVGPATGETKVFLLCTKIQRKSIQVRISDHNTLVLPPMPSTGWHFDKERSAYEYMVTNSQIETHHQYALIISMPAYHDSTITEQRRVWIQLLDRVDETFSVPVPFDYLPCCCPEEPETRISASPSPPVAGPTGIGYVGTVPP